MKWEFMCDSMLAEVLKVSSQIVQGNLDFDLELSFTNVSLQLGHIFADLIALGTQQAYTPHSAA